MKVWQPHLARCLKFGISDEGLLIYLDDILAWFDGLGTDSDEFSDSLLAEYSEQTLRERVEEVLERLVVDKNQQGQLFPSNLAAAHAKKRYRQLIDLFHPYQSNKDDEWLDYRTQSVNAAYERYWNNGAFPESAAEAKLAINLNSIPAGIKARSDKKKGQRRSGKPTDSSKPDPWHLHSAPSTLPQRNIIYGLAAAAAVLILVIYAGDFYSAKPDRVNKETVEKRSASPTTQDSMGSAAGKLADDSLTSNSDTSTTAGAYLAPYDADSDLGFDAGPDTVSSEALSSVLPSVEKLQGGELQEEEAPASINIDSDEGDDSPIENLAVDGPELSVDVPDELAADAIEDLTQPEALAANAATSEPLPGSAQLDNVPDKSALASSDAAERSGSDVVAPAEPISEQQGLVAAPAVSGQDISTDANNECGEPVDPQILPKSVTGQVKLETGMLRLRAGPSKACKTISFLSKGTRVEIMRCDAVFYWCYARVEPDSDSKVYGWLSDRFIEHDRGAGWPSE